MTEDLKHETGGVETSTGLVATEPEAGHFEGVASTDTLQGQATTTIIPPPAGQTVVLRPQPGERLELIADPADVRIAIEGNNVVLAFDLDGDGQPDSQVVLEELVTLAGSANSPALVVGGQTIAADALIGAAQALTSLDAGAPTLETAAGAGAEGTGATKYDDNLGEVIDLLVAQGVIPPVFLQFGLIEREEIVLFEESNEPPAADPMLTPADRGELPPDLVTALNNVVIHSETVTIAGPNLPGSVQYVFFTLAEPTAVTITTDGPTIDPHMFLFVDDGSLDVGDFLATDDDDGTPAGSFFNSVIETGDEIGILPAGNYVIAVSDFSLSQSEAISGLNDSTNLTGDVTVTVQANEAPSVVFFKQLNVDGAIGDDDLGTVADFGGADAETALGDLVFTLQSAPTFGQLILVASGGPTSFLTPGDTFTSADTVWWIATEAQIADFLAQPGAPEFLPNVDFLYSVTDEAGASATAPVTITLPPPQPPRTALGVFQDDCLNEDTEGTLAFNASPTDGASKISQIVISGFPTGGVEDAWAVDETSVSLDGLTFGVDFTASYDAGTGVLTIDIVTASVSLGEPINGTVDVTPNPDSDVDRTLTIEATAINGAGGETGEFTGAIPVDADADSGPGASGGTDDGDADILSISIDAIADGGDAGSSFQTGESGTVTVTATFDDYQDGSETHSFTLTAPVGFEIDGINAASLPLLTGVTFDLAPDGSAITFSLPTDALNGFGSLTVTLDMTNVSAAEGSPLFTASATASETATGDEECDPSDADNIATVSDEQSVTVAGVASPAVSINLENEATHIKEDSLDNLVQFSAATGDASDELTTVVIAFPTGVDASEVDFTTVAADSDVSNVDIDDNGGLGPVVVTITFDPGVTAFSGSFTLDAPVADSDFDLGSISIVANVRDQVDNDQTDSANANLQIDVDAVLDEALDPGLDSNVVETEIAAAQTIGLGLNASLISAGFVNDPPLGGDSGTGGADGDGSELISAVLVLDEALPGGITLSSTAGTVTQDLVNDLSGLTYVISGADLEAAIDGLEVNLSGSFQGTISGTVTVTSKEANTPPGDVVPASGEEPDTADNVKVLNADFSVTVNDGADPRGNTLNLTVDEKALDLVQDGSDLQAGTTFGTNAGSTAETDSGSLTFSAGADPIVDIAFGETAGIVVEDEGGNPITVDWTGSGTDQLVGKISGVTVIVLSLSGDNTAVAGGTANVTVTATLTDAFPHDLGNSGNVSISSIAVDADDDDGDTGTGTVNVTVLDDAPDDISPDNAVIGSNGSFPVVVTEDLDFFDNVGADKPGDVTFLASLDGTVLEDSGGDPVTSDGQPILLALSGDGHTLTGYVESGANTGFQPGEDMVILTAQLNSDATDEGADEYSITLSGPVDTGQQFGFDDFSGIGGGQAEFFPLSSSTNPGLMQDLLITGTVPGTNSVNTDNDDVGTGDQWLNNDINPATGEILRLDYVTNVGGNEDDISVLTYGTHYTVNDSGFRINQLQGSKTTTRTALVRVYDEDDDPEGNDFATDGAGDPAEQDDITQVRITFFSGGILREVVATADGPISAFGRTFTFSFAGDAVVIAGLLEGDQVFISTLDGFNQMEIQNTTSGNSLGIALDNFLVSTSQAGEPIDLSLGIEVTDEDGDTLTGTIDVTVLPQQVGTAGADSLTATANGSDLVGGTGNDTLTGSTTNDKLQGGDDADTIGDGEGNDIVIGGNGADTINLSVDGDTDVIIFDALSEAGDTVNGFDVAAPSPGGAGGDIIDLVDLMDSGTDFVGTTLADAQAQGYVQLFQSGADTEVRVDVNGGGDSFSMLVITLINTTAADLSDNIVVD